MAGRTLDWNVNGSGDTGVAANWTDRTTTVAATSVPDATDDCTIGGAAGSTTPNAAAFGNLTCKSLLITSTGNVAAYTCRTGDTFTFGNQTTTGTGLTLNPGALATGTGNATHLNSYVVLAGTVHQWGSVSIANSTLELKPGVSITIHDPADAGTLTWDIGNAVNLPNTRLFMNTANRTGTRSTIQAVTPGKHRLSLITTAGARRGCAMLYDVDFVNLGGNGPSTAVFCPFPNGSANNAQHFTLDNCTADNCGVLVNNNASTATGSTLRVDLRVKNSRPSVGQAIVILTATATTTAPASTDRLVTGVYDRPVSLSQGALWRFRDIVVANVGATSTVNGNPLQTNSLTFAEFDNVVVLHQGVYNQNAPNQANAAATINMAFSQTYKNLMWIAMGAMVGGTLQGQDSQWALTQQNGAGTLATNTAYDTVTISGYGGFFSNDFFSENAPVAAHKETFRRVLVLPDGIDKTQQSTCIWSPIGNKPNLTGEVDFCTWFSNATSTGGAESGIKFGESQSATTGKPLVNSARSNIVVSTDKTNAYAEVIQRQNTGGFHESGNVNKAQTGSNLVVGGRTSAGDGIAYFCVSRTNNDGTGNTGFNGDGTALPGIADVNLAASTANNALFSDGSLRVPHEYWAQALGHTHTVAADEYAACLADILGIVGYIRDLGDQSVRAPAISAWQTWVRAGYAPVHTQAYNLSMDTVYQPNAGAVAGTSPTAPTIGVSTAGVTFNAQQGGSAPAEQTKAITNTGTGSLSGLSASITYGSGSGWLSVTLDGTSDPTTLRLNAAVGSLTPGTYTATVSVASTASGVTNSPQTFSVTFGVTAASVPGTGRPAKFLAKLYAKLSDGKLRAKHG